MVMNLISKIKMYQFRKFIRLCNYFKPKIIRGYASSLVDFAEYIDKYRSNFYNPLSVISSAEVLTEKNRSYIESILKTKVLNSYGCREVSQIAME